MAKRVLLVDAPFHAFFEYERWWYSFSCAQLAGCLLEKGIETFVYDGDKYFKKDPLTKQRKEMVRRQGWYKDGVSKDDHYIWKHFRKTLDELKPDIVGISVWTCSLSSSIKVLEICKDFNTNIKTCVGGYHVTALPDYFKNLPYVDTIFIGPAEEALPHWILGGCKERFLATDPRSVDIKKIPAPSRESLLYPEFFSSSDMGMLMASRGCPSNCSFCSNKLLTGQKYQFRTIPQIRQEIEHIITKYNVKSLNLIDANFLSNPTKALEIAELIKSFGIPWGTAGLVNIITEELIEKLIDCGCNSLAFGIESGSQTRLMKLNKKIRLEQIEKAAEILNRYKMNWKTFFIVGFPDDTLEEMEETRRFALKIRPSYISLNSFSPLPGTDIYNAWAPTFNYSIEDIAEYNQLNLKTDFMINMDLQTYRKKFTSILDEFDVYNAEVDSIEKFKNAEIKN
ncbi:B12-binding domain-containing radical SAM protein [Candidatus Omnitrophota bacterium]